VSVSRPSKRVAVVIRKRTRKKTRKRHAKMTVMARNHRRPCHLPLARGVDLLRNMVVVVVVVAMET
jgi:hypothetical protein